MAEKLREATELIGQLEEAAREAEKVDLLGPHSEDRVTSGIRRIHAGFRPVEEKLEEDEWSGELALGLMAQLKKMMTLKKAESEASRGYFPLELIAYWLKARIVGRQIWRKKWMTQRKAESVASEGDSLPDSDTERLVGTPKEDSANDDEQRRKVMEKELEKQRQRRLNKARKIQKKALLAKEREEKKKQKEAAKAKKRMAKHQPGMFVDFKNLGTKKQLLQIKGHALHSPTTVQRDMVVKPNNGDMDVTPSQISRLETNGSTSTEHLPKLPLPASPSDSSRTRNENIVAVTFLKRAPFLLLE